jgi:hypothetical protein
MKCRQTDRPIPCQVHRFVTKQHFAIVFEPEYCKVQKDRQADNCLPARRRLAEKTTFRNLETEQDTDGQTNNQCVKFSGKKI